MKKIATLILAAAMMLTLGVAAYAADDDSAAAEENTTTVVNTTTVSLENPPFTMELSGSWAVWTTEYHDEDLEEEWGETTESWQEWADEYNYVAEIVKRDNTRQMSVAVYDDARDALGENWLDATEDDLNSYASAIVYSISEDDRSNITSVTYHETDAATFIVIDAYYQDYGYLVRDAYTVNDGRLFCIAFSMIYDGTNSRSDWNTVLDAVTFEYTPREEEKADTSMQTGKLMQNVGVILLFTALVLVCIIIYGKLKKKK